MNTDILQGKWNQVKGSIKEAFGKLTDDDMTQIEGSTDRMVGILQERYGYSKDQAQQEWDKFSKHQSSAVDNAKSTAKSTMDNAKQAVDNFVADTKQKVNRTADSVADSGAQAARRAADRLDDAVKR